MRVARCSMYPNRNVQSDCVNSEAPTECPIRGHPHDLLMQPRFRVTPGPALSWPDEGLVIVMIQVYSLPSHLSILPCPHRDKHSSLRLPGYTELADTCCLARAGRCKWLEQEVLFSLSSLA